MASAGSVTDPAEVGNNLILPGADPRHRHFIWFVTFPIVAFRAVLVQVSAMSDKQLALESIQRLPEDASLDAIAERLEFLAGIRKGLDQIERGETVSHEEVKRQLATWLTK